MTLPAKVITFLRKHATQSHCDECIAQKLGLRHTNRVQVATTTLGLIPGFVRKSGECSGCGMTRQVIHALSKGKPQLR
jgi:hypothetical protein